MYSSQLVIREASLGDPEFSQKRLNILKDFPALELREDVVELAGHFVHNRILPAKAGDDALHIAIATIYGLDYLLTWNCKHIANAEIQKRLAIASSEFRFMIFLMR
ncbi:MAG: type II toxin-antitoxin system VapC family toxin [bacterium]|nr:type II toxin-antitoxin system VapC family toxin [bacterium]